MIFNIINDMSLKTRKNISVFIMSSVKVNKNAPIVWCLNKFILEVAIIVAAPNINQLLVIILTIFSPLRYDR